ncbi:uncharacterized protein A4U43_C04F880 [Asparagus officinalis]|uniref:Uncharacterized protein n=1 Tax=Asparagus officinalis TaxID=4686 RepID=A0A5P1EXD7_ASPOF|nr:uncharacterized protein A4U43_C04F880 [Asparagus officinalis]
MRVFAEQTSLRPAIPPTVLQLPVSDEKTSTSSEPRRRTGSPPGNGKDTILKERVSELGLKARASSMEALGGFGIFARFLVAGLQTKRELGFERRSNPLQTPRIRRGSGKKESPESIVDGSTKDREARETNLGLAPAEKRPAIAGGSFLWDWGSEIRDRHDFDTHWNLSRDLMGNFDRISNKTSSG